MSAWKYTCSATCALLFFSILENSLCGPPTIPLVPHGLLKTESYVPSPVPNAKTNFGKYLAYFIPIKIAVTFVSDILRYVNYSIDNTFVSFCNQVYRLSIGIPMGRNDASHLANIFLHMYEKPFFQYLQNNYQPEIITNDLIIFGMHPQR